MAAAQLARRAPEEWDIFLIALAEHTDMRRDECVQAQPEMILVAQGRAQACVKLEALFADCREEAEAISKMQSKPRPPR
jgi:hypothetical protein